MWTIRQEQVEAFRQGTLQKFEDRMVEHIRKFFPEQFEALGETKAREKIQHGVQRAANYGIVEERSVCKYVDLMFTFGFNFDTREPWLSVFRVPASDPDFDQKLDELYDALFTGKSRSGSDWLG